MQRTICTFSIDKIDAFKKNLFAWSQQFETIAWLESNSYIQEYTELDCVLAADEFTSIKTDYSNAFDKLKEYQTITNDYIFGYLSYVIKNDTEQLSSNNFDGLKFSDIYFFQPQKLVFIRGSQVEFRYLKMVEDEIEKDFKEIQKHEDSKNKTKYDLKIKSRINKDQYLSKVSKVINHIKRGDIYEANFCQEFYAENAIVDPYKIYTNLNKISKAPFASFLKIDEHFLLSASPERYIKKDGTKIISQPIKGTARRSKNKYDDQKIAINLARDEKEYAENVMIVDLVRNDLSKTSKIGSVKVEELCKVYTFKQVHQMISTVVSSVDKKTHPVEVLRSTFPMGSMTGAPKVSAMKIIENLEVTKRGLYSGAVGYFTPENNFDFNVVIRSILYNKKNEYISYSVGSAITAKSVPENEYDECLLKAKAMKQVLEKYK